MGELRKVTETSNLPPGTAMAIDVEGRRLALFNVDGTYYAIDDTCTHSGGPLSEGDIEGTQVSCPWHGACFNLTDGSVLTPPADEGVTSYRVVVEGEDIKVEMP